MRIAETRGMGKELALLGLLPLLIACGGRTERSLDLDGTPESSSGDNGYIVDTGPVGGIEQPDEDSSSAMPAQVEPEPALESPACTAAPVAKPTARLPATSPLSNGPATVVSATANGLELETVDGISQFAWFGPSLGALFAPKEIVELSSFWTWSETPDDWHLVESDSVVIATLSGSWPMPLSPEPGWEVGPTIPIGFPNLDFINRGCCQRAGIGECDYSDLRVTIGDQLAHIPRGMTAQVGAWSITNLGAVWEDGYLLSLGVTLIGPAAR
jgi:hypothetical protein